MLTGDTHEAVEAATAAAGGPGIVADTPEPAPAAKGGGKAKKKKLGWREAASRRFEEAKAGASRLAEQVGAEAARAQQSAAVSIANARSEIERRQLEGRVAKEDKFANAWRNTCMVELDDEAVARERVFTYASRGKIEVDNPMAVRALSTVDASCTALSGRLVEQDALVETIATSGEKVAETTEQLMISLQNNIQLMMPQELREAGALERTTKEINAGMEGASFRRLSSALRTALVDRSTAFTSMHKKDIKPVRNEFIATTSAMRESMKSLLKEQSSEAFEERQIMFDSKRRLAQASRAKLTQQLVGARTAAFVTPIEQMAALIEAQKTFFREGLQALELLQPHIDEMRTHAEGAQQHATRMKDKLATLTESLQTDETGSVLLGEPLPENRVLRAGISVLGKHLGPPQHQGFLYQSGLRRWCVLVNGKLYEYADDWLNAPLSVTNMFLCNAKASDSGLRYSFELMSMAPGDFDPKSGPPKPLIYQALDEEDMSTWLRIITECTEFMITHQPSGKEDEAVEEDPQVVAIRSIAGNELCADCSRASPEWVSISLGTTICTECSGAHRGLGVHISKVQSLALDKLDQSTLDMLKVTGNQFTNSMWESGGVPDGTKPGPQASREELAEFITKKYKGHEFVSEDLLAEVKLDKTNTAVAEATLAGKLRDVARCFVGGADVNSVPSKYADLGKTLLMLAIESNSIPTLELILNNSPNLDAADKKGKTALHHAVSSKRVKVLGLLVKRGAWRSLDVPDHDGATPRSIAAALDTSDLGADEEIFKAHVATAIELVKEQKVQATRMAAGKVFYNADRVLRQGQINEAIEELEKGVQMDSDHTEMQELLTQAKEIQQALGDEADAEQVENWFKKYRLKLQVNGVKDRVSSRADQAKEKAKEAKAVAAAGLAEGQRRLQERKILADYVVQGEPDHKGWLQLKNAHKSEPYKKFWFELRSTDLVYFEVEGGSPKGILNMVGKEVRADKADDWNSEDSECEVEILSAEQLFRLKCSDDKNREEWIQALQSIARMPVSADDKSVEEGVPPSDATEQIGEKHLEPTLGDNLQEDHRPDQSDAVPVGTEVGDETAI